MSKPTTKTIGRFEITATPWQKHGKNRIYFDLSNRGGQACWDVEKQEWVRVRNEVGARFKRAIKEAFEL